MLQKRPVIVETKRQDRKKKQKIDLVKYLFPKDVEISLLILNTNRVKITQIDSYGPKYIIRLTQSSWATMTPVTNQT